MRDSWQARILPQDCQIRKCSYNVAADVSHAGQKLKYYVCLEKNIAVSLANLSGIG
jgi:hypothetical protein